MKGDHAVLADTTAFPSYSVNDVTKARRFYHDTLGLDVKEISQGLELEVGNGSKVFLYEKPDHKPATFTVLNFEVGNVEDAVSELAGDGVTFERYDRPDLTTDERGIARFDGGPAMAWFKDPAGNILSVIEGDR